MDVAACAEGCRSTFITSFRSKTAATTQKTNAAPLCPTCHRQWGNNPDHRKIIADRRDAHYDRCRNADIAADIAADLAAIQAKLDSQAAALVRLESIGLARAPIRLDDTEYSFTREEFVHPLIVLELLGWISDTDETICSVDLCTANKSNRFYGEFSTDHVDGRNWVRGRDDTGMDIRYAHIATTQAGTELVECYTWRRRQRHIWAGCCLPWHEGRSSIWTQPNRPHNSRQRWAGGQVLWQYPLRWPVSKNWSGSRLVQAWERSRV